MIFDTDVIIWAFRNNRKAQKLIDQDNSRNISAITYMELLQGAKNKLEQEQIKHFIKHMNFRILPITENITHRAIILFEELSMKSGLGIPDALIFATSCELSIRLCSANKKHYKDIESLDVLQFCP